MNNVKLQEKMTNFLFELNDEKTNKTLEYFYNNIPSSLKDKFTIEYEQYKINANDMNKAKGNKIMIPIYNETYNNSFFLGYETNEEGYKYKYIIEPTGDIKLLVQKDKKTVIKIEIPPYKDKFIEMNKFDPKQVLSIYINLNKDNFKEINYYMSHCPFSYKIIKETKNIGLYTSDFKNIRNYKNDEFFNIFYNQSYKEHKKMIKERIK